MGYDELNEEALKNPKVGDYWHERFSPYFIVVKVDDEKITILDAIDRIDHGDSWSFDYYKHKVVNHLWMEQQVMYNKIHGFVADVRRGEKYASIAEEWKTFNRNRLEKELAEFL